jgi:hypothetical protein
MHMNMMQSIAIPVLRNATPASFREWARDLRNAWRVKRNPGRIVLVNEIIPAYSRLKGRIFWVGCRRYTRNYGVLLERGGGNAGAWI